MKAADAVVARLDPVPVLKGLVSLRRLIGTIRQPSDDWLTARLDGRAATSTTVPSCASTSSRIHLNGVA
jgi:hypothetical protein